MCGIVGIFGKLSADHDRAFKNMLVFDSIRGTDSTGVAAVGRYVDTMVAKQVGNPFELMEHASFDKAVNRINRCLIGHNRYKTTGAGTRRNAHPFDFETLVGVHNGTLTNKYKLDDAADFQVDSENLYHHINKKGIKDAISISEGAWSLVWWDKIEETINFLRNDERPMYMAREDNGNTVFFASEAWMISVASSRNKIKLDGEIVQTEVDMLYSFGVNKLGEIDKPKVSKMAGKPKTVYQGHQYDNQAWRNGLGGGYQSPKPHPQQQQMASTSSTSTGITNAIVDNGNTFSPEKPATNKVIHLNPKNSRPAGGNATVSPLPLKSFQRGTLTGTKGAILEVLESNIDERGAAYVSCFYHEAPSTNFRLYLNRLDDPQKLIGEDIFATISNFVTEKPTSNKGGYYKLEYASFRLVNPKGDDVTFITSGGHAVSKAEWEKLHGQCCWCSADIEAGSYHRFMKDGSCLCEVCADDELVKEYING